MVTNCSRKKCLAIIPVLLLFWMLLFALKNCQICDFSSYRKKPRVSRWRPLLYFHGSIAVPFSTEFYLWRHNFDSLSCSRVFSPMVHTFRSFKLRNFLSLANFDESWMFNKFEAKFCWNVWKWYIIVLKIQIQEVRDALTQTTV